MPCLTGYDMVMLRLTYAPELEKRHDTRPRWRRLLPALLARMNPAGGRFVQPAAALPTPRNFQTSLDAALSGGTSQSRRNAARDAVGNCHAPRAGPMRGRVLPGLRSGGLSATSDPAAARAALLRAGAIYRAMPGRRDPICPCRNAACRACAGARISPPRRWRWPDRALARCPRRRKPGTCGDAAC